MRIGALTSALLLALAGCGRMPVTPDSQAEPRPDVHIPLASEELTLDNGLRVVLAPDRAADAVVVNVSYRAGSRDDPAGRAGLAHLVEHLTFLGSPGSSEVDFYTRLGEIGGGHASGSTDLDATEFVTVTRPSLVARGLWLEAARMAQPLRGLDDGRLAAERSVVKNEIRERCDADPTVWPRAIARRAVFGEGHPYGHAPMGTFGGLDATSADDARTFAAQHYRPDNATLVVAGAFDPVAVKAVIRTLFARIPPGPARAPRTFPAVRATRSSETSVRLAVDRARVVYAWPLPARGADGARELEIASGALAIELVYELVLHTHLASDVKVALDPGELGSLLTVTVAPLPGADLSTVAGTLDRALDQIAAQGRLIEWPEFEAGRHRYIAERLRTLAELTPRTHELQDGVTYHGGANGVRTEIGAFANIIAGDVGSAAAQFLVGRPRHVVVVVPDPNGPHPGSAPP